MITEILAECKQKGITLEPLPEGKIKCVPGSKVDTPLLKKIRDHKKDLLNVLTVIRVFDGEIDYTNETFH
ncbi:MAG: hypothetical protein GX654_14205 [Desulfatiglans sp.]|nr:hypothetical protein [Desulfatiglans sp.]